MKPELMLLVWAVTLTVVQMLIAATGMMLQVGVPALAGNREALPAFTGWAGRACRAHHNMLENLVLFAALVLVAVATGKSNPTVLFGAQIFLWARVAYAAAYLIGVPWLRTGIWLVSMAGLVMMFLQLVR